MTQTSTENFVYTALIELGTPAQNAEVIVDINYPTTVIFSNETEVWYNNETSGVSGYIPIDGEPYYLNPFFYYLESSTYLQFSQQSWINNVILNGYRFAGRLATDNICLNRIEHDSKYCYNTVFVNTAYV